MFSKMPRLFATLFQPDCRALAVGTIIGISQDQPLRIVDPSPQIYHQGSLIEQWPLCVISFYGCSGGMVAVFLPDATPGERTVKMIGMCKYILSAWYRLLTSI